MTFEEWLDIWIERGLQDDTLAHYDKLAREYIIFAPYQSSKNIPLVLLLNTEEELKL